MQPFIITSQLTEKEFASAYSRLIISSLPRRIKIVGVFFLSIFILNAIFSYRLNLPGRGSVQPFFIILLIIGLYVFITWRSAIKVYRKSMDFQNPVVYDFDDGSLRTKTINTEARSNWDIYKKLVVMKHFMFLKTQTGLVVIFKKELFTPEQIQWLKLKVNNRQ